MFLFYFLLSLIVCLLYRPHTHTGQVVCVSVSATSATKRGFDVLELKEEEGRGK